MVTQTAFIKMDGTGNDFVIFDARQASVMLSPEKVCKLANRTHPETKGCDQVVIIEPSDNADCFMRIYNADGGEVSACGNATRCVGWLLAQERGEADESSIHIETSAGILKAFAGLSDPNAVGVDMGKPSLEWQDIPLAQEMDTLHLNISEGPLSDPVGVSMGNPHAVFFVEDAQAIDFTEIGPALEHHPLFPERANIGVAQIVSDNTIRLRVFERGVGETAACGTGACAALVAAHRRGLTGRSAFVQVNGGELLIEWLEDNHVMMMGPTKLHYKGTVDLSEK